MQPLRRAVIFDLDGVLVDSYRAHFLSWRDVAAQHGIGLTEARFAATFGRTSREIIAELWPAPAPDAVAAAALDQAKEAGYREIVAADFPVMDGAPDLLDALQDAGWALAVGSSGPPENVALALRHLGGAERFGAVVTGMDVTRGKPDPEVFLLAARRLGCEPAACVVVEDAPAGVEAARRAGMATVALLSAGHAPDDYRRHPPQRMVRSLGELTPVELGRLTAGSRPAPG